MKIDLIVLVVHLFFFASCQGKTENNHVNTSNVKHAVEPIETGDVKRIKSSQIFRYKVNNADYKQFGFLPVEEDQSIGVRSIIVSGNFIFVTDPFHGNIKKIDMKNGRVAAVSTQLDTGNNLRTITVFNNAIYVLTDNEKIFLLDFTLNKINELVIPKYRWVKDIFNQTENELVLFRPIEDVVQQADISMKIKMVKIDVTNAVKRDSLQLSYDEYNKSYYAVGNIRGKQYKYLNEEGKHFIVNEYGKFELKEKLPDTYKYYESKNIDFMVNSIVYFSVSRDEVVLTVNEYKFNYRLGNGPNLLFFISNIIESRFSRKAKSTKWAAN